MSVFMNKDVKRIFVILLCAAALFIILSQGYFLSSYGAIDTILLLISLLFAVGVVIGVYAYFRRQQQIIDTAVSQINLFISGDRDARIDSDSEGDLFKLFHAVNTLATTLNAHALREEGTKNFLKETIADISHQLKTPLAALAIYNALLQEESENETAVCEFALKSEKEIERIETLVQSLLKITRLDAGFVVMEKRIEYISDMMRDIKTRFETRAEQEQKEITLSGSLDTALLCDRYWIIEAVSNIIKNALDHTGEGGQIKVSWSNLPSVTQIVIADNGSGIHTEDIHHIFKRFYRSRFSKDRQGVGLGLPLAKAVVESHDGNIAVESVLGGGSTFTMSFLNLTKL